MREFSIDLGFYDEDGVFFYEWESAQNGAFDALP